MAGWSFVALGLGAVFGVLARRRFWTGAAGFVAFGVLGGWPRPWGRRRDSAAWLSAAVATGRRRRSCSWLLLRLAAAPPTARADRHRVDAAERRRASCSGRGHRAGRDLGRRRRAVPPARRQRRGGPGPAGGPARVEAGAARHRPASTPSIDVDGHHAAGHAERRLLPHRHRHPRAPGRPGGWRCGSPGMVDRAVELELDELLAMDLVDEYVTLSCVSNEVGGDLVGNPWWRACRSPTCSTGPACSPSADPDRRPVGRRLDRRVPDEVAVDGRPAHGRRRPWTANRCRSSTASRPGWWCRPVRLRVGHQVAGRDRAHDVGGFDGYWIPRGWAKEGPIKTQSRIDVPRTARPCRPGGPRSPAWRGRRPGGSAGRGAGRRRAVAPAPAVRRAVRQPWVQWVAEWDADARAAHRLQVRATDGTGETQTADTRHPRPRRRHRLAHRPGPPVGVDGRLAIAG